MFVSFNGFAPVTLCNLCLHRAIMSPFSFLGRMTEGIGMYRGLQPPNMCEVSLWERVSAPAGVAPEALEECLYSSKVQGL